LAIAAPKLVEAARRKPGRGQAIRHSEIRARALEYGDKVASLVLHLRETANGLTPSIAGCSSPKRSTKRKPASPTPGGVVTITTVNTAANPAKTTGCVSNVTHPSLTYNPAANVKTL
jgi:hypothetical protein